MENAVGASSWKPTSPISASAKTPSAVATRAMAAQQQESNASPYWSPSTHSMSGGINGGLGSPGGNGEGMQQINGDGDGSLALNAQEFIPGGSSGATEFVPGMGEQLQQLSPQNQRLPEQQAQQNLQQQDGRMYDQLLQEQNGATYSETPLVQPAPKKKTIGSFFMSDRLQERYQHLNECTLRELVPQDPKIKLIPTGYTSIFPLDSPGRDNSSTAGSFGYPSTVFKVVSERSGIALALRRFDNIKSSPQAAAEIADRWKHATHPNIIQLHGAWVHQRALFFTHDYHPGAQTLQERYLVQRGALIPESTVWAYICQLVTALRAIHALGLACRVIHPLRILWTSPNRIRINCVGVLDVLESDSQKTLDELQREDIFKLGRLILELTTRLPIEHLQRVGIQEALDGVAQHYSVEVVNLIKMLMQGQSSVYELCTMLTGQLVGQLDQTYAHSDALENELSKQFNSGRMLRVLLKTNLVNGRPEMGMDRNWSETGDRYVLSLFSNYLFHQHGPNGEPIVDYGHIIESLNKLDAGSTEKILLTSRGGKAVIVASFDEIRRCIHESFLELVRAGSGPGVLEEQQNVMYQEQQQRQMYQQMYAAQSGGGGGGVGGGMGGAGGYGGSMGGGVQGGQQYYGNSGGGGGVNPYANGGAGGGVMQQQGGYGGGSFMQHQ